MSTAPGSGAGAAPGRAVSAAPRSFLFLQGPASRFFDELARALLARGHRVHRVNLHLGDQLFWRLPATDYRGRFDDWRPFIAGLLEGRQVTDVIMLGDRRPYHIVAAEEARRRGIAVLAVDLGYLRPDWITLEYDGMSTYSRFPRDPAAIRALAARLPAPDLETRFATPFALVALLVAIYNAALAVGRLLFPHYRRHGVFSPFAESAGWVATLVRRRLRAPATVAAKRRLQREAQSYFLFPLQLATDFQIRAHSPFADARDALRLVIASFAASGSRRKLAIVSHPLDNSLTGWSRLARAWAEELGVAGQVVALADGVPIELLRNAAGVVTVNSTVGLTALRHGVPVKVLGNAVYDVPGLTYRESLDAFWGNPLPPEPELTAAFVQALAGATQIKGSYYTRASRSVAVAGAVERLERGPFPLPPLTAAELRARQVRPSTKNVAIIGAADGVALALARAYAAPGVGLVLIASSGDALAVAAEDCRRRGAAVETRCHDPRDGAAVAADLVALDAHAPLDVLVDASSADRSRSGGAWEQASASMLEPVAERMRRRGQGRIALVGDLADRTLLSYGGVLRRRLRPYNVTVSVAGPPGRVATRLALFCREPRVAELGDDRAASLIRRGIARGRKRIATPGALTAVTRALRPFWGRLRAWVAAPFSAPLAPVAEAAEQTTSSRETSAGG